MTAARTNKLGLSASWTVLCLSLWILAGSSFAFAATFYVAKTGSNSNPGTVGSPWLTLQFAENTTTPGDTILVQPGIYPERVVTTHASTTFQATPHTVTNYGFNIGHSFRTVDGFDVIGDVPSQPTYSGAIEVYRNLTDINIINNYIHDFDPIGHYVQGIHFYFASTAAQCARNVVISNNVLRNTSYQMMSLMCSNALVCNNYLDFANSHDALHVFGRKITICDNIITNISVNPLVPDHTDILQTFGNEDVESYDVIFERNLVINCDAQLCQLEQKGKANIRSWTVRNNLWIGTQLGGNVDIEDMDWHNNTFFRCTKTTSGPILLNCNTKGCATNANIFNDIFYQCGSDPITTQKGWYHPFISTGFTMGWLADYNMVCGPGEKGKGSNWGTLGHEVNGHNGGNPVFVDQDNGDFRLCYTSPLLGVGTNLSALFNDDYLKQTRSASWDLGAIAGGWPITNSMRLVPAGSFTMGDPYGEISGGDAAPLHPVDVSSFYIRRFETSNREVAAALQYAWDNGLIYTPNFRLIKSTIGDTNSSLYDLQFDDYGTNSVRYYSGIRMTNGVFSLYPGREDQPCINISWNGAAAVCNYLSLLASLTPCFELTNYTCTFSNSGYRLPTEAEWEKAARGGLATNHYPWPSAGSAYSVWSSTNIANYTPSTLGHPFNQKTIGFFNGNQYATPGTYTNQSNGYGLYDMAGNAQEWCYDWYQPDWYSQPGATNANTIGPAFGGSVTNKVSRGGSFDLDDRGCLCAARQFWPPATANGASWYNSFRMVLNSDFIPTPPPSPPAPVGLRATVNRRVL